MYGQRRARSPGGSPTAADDDDVAAEDARSATARWNPSKRRPVERGPRTGAEPAAAPGAPRPDPAPASQATQGRQDASSHVFLVLLEPGTDLHLRLGDEALVLAPQTALQLALRDVLVVVLPWHVASSSEELSFPGHARCLVPRDPDVAWAIDVDDGSLSARSAGVGAEEAEAPPGTLLLRPLRRAAGPQGGPGLPGPRPRPVPRPVPPEFSLDLRGLRPCPGSALRPLPASPSPGPRPCRVARRRPPTGARRRLF